TENLSKGVKGLKIGVPAEYFAEWLTAEVKDAVNAALKEYEKLGAEIVPMSLPLTKYGVAIYYVTMPGELSTNLARFDGLRFGHKPEGTMEDLNDYYKKVRSEGFGPEIKRRIMVGTFVLSAGNSDAYYKQAQRARTLVIAEFAEAFKKVDVLIAPVSPTVAFKVGEKASDPLAMYLADALAIPGSAAGLPALAVPCGFNKDGLPLGFQIMGPHWSEALVLQVGAAYEQATDWHKKHPSF
ncbi:MAG: amidase, partial [Patescibacteria group bacterium]